MTKYEFVKRFLPEAEAAEKRFRINPVIMLAQAAIESGWGESDLAIAICSVSPDMGRPTNSGTVTR